MPLLMVPLLLIGLRIFDIISIRLAVVDRVWLNFNGGDAPLKFLELITLEYHNRVIPINP